MRLNNIVVAVIIFISTESFAFNIGVIDSEKWGIPGLGNSGGTVSYSFMSSGSTGCNEAGISSGCADLNTLFGGAWESEIERAFSAWSAVADIDFVRVVDQNEGFTDARQSGQIRIGAHNSFESDTLAHAYIPANSPLVNHNPDGDIHFNAERSWQVGNEGSGVDLFLVALHEIGHSLGLTHEDKDVALAIMNSVYNSNLTGLTEDDIKGIQAIYGPRSLTAVPEPGTWILMLAGLSFLMVTRRRSSSAMV